MREYTRKDVDAVVEVRAATREDSCRQVDRALTRYVKDRDHKPVKMLLYCEGNERLWLVDAVLLWAKHKLGDDVIPRTELCLLKGYDRYPVHLLVTVPSKYGLDALL